jgi:hypothetical protein
MKAKDSNHDNQAHTHRTQNSIAETNKLLFPFSPPYPYPYPFTPLISFHSLQFSSVQLIFLRRKFGKTSNHPSLIIIHSLSSSHHSRKKKLKSQKLQTQKFKDTSLQPPPFFLFNSMVKPVS